MGNQPSKEVEEQGEAAGAKMRAELDQQTAKFQKQAEDAFKAQQLKTSAFSKNKAKSVQHFPKLKRSSKGHQALPKGDPKPVDLHFSSFHHSKSSAVTQSTGPTPHERNRAVRDESMSEAESIDSDEEGPIDNLLKPSTTTAKSATGTVPAPAVQHPKRSKALSHRIDRAQQSEVTASGSRKPRVPPNNSAIGNSSDSASKTPASALGKRSATNAFIDERRTGLAQTRNASKSVGAALLDEAPRKKTKVAQKEAITSIDERPPLWYKSLKFEPSRNARQASTASVLEALKADIKKTQDPGFFKDGNRMKQVFNNLRRRLHDVPFQPVSAQLLRNNFMLHDGSGLPVLFAEKYPWDIRADAHEQYNKWCLQEFETDLLHHIERGVPKNSAATGSYQDKVDPEYRKSAKFFGNGLLLNGQWWPTQLTVFRDGAHGETIKGISGSKMEGAYSCIMSGGTGYDNKNGDGNEDEGDVVYYCGMDSTTGSITEETQMLMRNEEGAKPVRFIRSHQCPNKAFAPEIGFRYDGLYDVVNHSRIDDESSVRQRIRFKLVRVKDQDPIRAGGPEKRPTEKEMEVYRSDRRFRGYT